MSNLLFSLHMCYDCPFNTVSFYKEKVNPSAKTSRISEEKNWGEFEYEQGQQKINCDKNYGGF